MPVQLCCSPARQLRLSLPSRVLLVVRHNGPPTACIYLHKPIWPQRRTTWSLPGLRAKCASGRPAARNYGKSRGNIMRSRAAGPPDGDGRRSFSRTWQKQRTPPAWRSSRVPIMARAKRGSFDGELCQARVSSYYIQTSDRKRDGVKGIR